MEMKRIESMDKSDVEGDGFEEECQRYAAKSRKRALEVDAAEGRKRKVSFAEFHMQHTTRYQLVNICSHFS